MQKTYYERYLNMLEKMGIDRNTFETDIFKGLDPYLKNDKIVDSRLFYNAVLQHSPRMGMIVSSVPDEQGATMLNILMQTYYFWKYDKKIYNLSKRLTSSLMFTRSDKIPARFIRFPHKSMYFSIPNNYFTIKNEETGIHKVSGIFVLSEQTEGADHLRIMITGDANEKSVNLDDDCIFFYRIKVKHNRFSASGQVEEVKVGDPDSWNKEGVMAFRKDYYEDQMKSTIDFIFNLAIYMQTGELPTELKSDPIRNITTNNPKKRKKQLRDNAGYSALKYYELDDPRLEDFFKDGAPDGNITERIRYKTRWIVSGHNHLYWTGKGRTIPRIKWVAPYWKGLNRLEAVDEN